VEIMHDGQEQGIDAGVAVLESPTPFEPDTQDVLDLPTTPSELRECRRQTLEDYRQILEWSGIRATGSSGD
jgi:hypothetical protein